MHRIVFVGEVLQQHLEILERSPETYRPARCPHCGMAGVWSHGRYFRKADRSPGGDFNPVAIPRYRCDPCGGTCSRLPVCVAPRRWYGWIVQQWVLMWLLWGGSVSRARFWTGLARRTIARWRDRLTAHTARWAMALRNRFAELGRAGDDPEAFWRACLDRMPLSAAMGWLDRDGECVP